MPIWASLVNRELPKVFECRSAGTPLDLSVNATGMGSDLMVPKLVHHLQTVDFETSNFDINFIKSQFTSCTV